MGSAQWTWLGQFVKRFWEMAGTVGVPGSEMCIPSSAHAMFCYQDAASFLSTCMLTGMSAPEEMKMVLFQREP